MVASSFMVGYLNLDLVVTKAITSNFDFTSFNSIKEFAIFFTEVIFIMVVIFIASITVVIFTTSITEVIFITFNSYVINPFDPFSPFNPFMAFIFKIATLTFKV